jgi:molybdopterin molybdotransferase
MSTPSAISRAVSAADARRILGEAVREAQRWVKEECVPLAEAAGRVLAAPLLAPEDLPAFPRSLMDGYAVRAADVAGASETAPARLTVVGAVVAGERPEQSLAPGEAIAIPTGGHLPPGADAVVMIEHVVVEDDQMDVRQPVMPGRNVMAPGEDVARGAPVLGRGRRLRPSDLAAFAALGVAEAAVFRRPRVAVLSTGSEICPPEVTPPPGKVRDANQVALLAAAAAAGCLVTAAGIVADDPRALTAAVRDLAARHEVVILSGGSSVGGRDHTGEVFGRLGPPGVLFHGINVRPGRPTLIAQVAGTLLVGLPGVPTAALIIFEAFVRPALWALGGEEGGDPWPARRQARLVGPHQSARGREDYLRVRFLERDGELWAEAVPGGSASLSNVVGADGLVIVPPEVEALAAGAPVTVCLL